MRLRLCCPAKVNLHLEVLGRRPDGYHELRTLFAAVGAYDDLEVTGAPSGTLSLEVRPAHAVTAGEDNIVLRAARAVQRLALTEAGAHLVLTKRIPVAAGLGGGSSDAAATLVGLDRLWGLNLGAGGLHGVAADLGADVPFFLLGGVAWGEGRGTELRPLPDLPPFWVVLLPGAEAIPTVEVYRRLRAPAVGAVEDSAVYHWAARGGLLPFAACRNDLERAVVEGWPEVGERLEALRCTSPLLARVSGSGGTVFGLYADEPGACAAARALSRRQPLVVPLLDRGRSAPVAAEG